MFQKTELFYTLGSNFTCSKNEKKTFKKLLIFPEMKPSSPKKLPQEKLDA